MPILTQGENYVSKHKFPRNIVHVLSWSIIHSKIYDALAGSNTTRICSSNSRIQFRTENNELFYTLSSIPWNIGRPSYPLDIRNSLRCHSSHHEVQANAHNLARSTRSIICYENVWKISTI